MAAIGEVPQSMGPLYGPSASVSGLRWVASLLPECPAREDVACVATELGTNAARFSLLYACVALDGPESEPMGRQRPPAFFSLLLFTALGTCLDLVRVPSAHSARQNGTRRPAGALPSGGGSQRIATQSFGTRQVRTELERTSSGLGGWFAVEITWHQSAVRVVVADCGGLGGPQVIDDLAGVHGRGLLVVAGLPVRTGVRGDQRGRLVWADIPRGDAGAAEPASPRHRYQAAIRGSRAGLGSRFAGVPPWFGRSMLQWRALAGSELVAARSAQELARLPGRVLDHPRHSGVLRRGRRPAKTTGRPGLPAGSSGLAVSRRSSRPRAQCREPADPFERLRATAVATLRRHIPGTDRRCHCCGAAWPCAAVCLAEFNLGVL